MSYRLRSAVAAALMPGALIAAGMTQTGCDTEVAKADKAMYAAVEKSAEKATRTKTDAEPVVAAVQKSSIAGAEKAAAALTPLGGVDSTKPESLGDWKAAERTLTIRQREAINTALRTISIEDRKALITALEEAAKTAGTSPEAQVDPLMRVATYEAGAADAIAREASIKEVESARLVEECHRLLGQIKLNNSRVAAYNLRKPTATEADLDAHKTKIAGTAPDSIWMGAADAVMPAGTRIDAEAAKAQTDLDALNTERKQTVDKATNLRQAAAGLLEEAKKDSGKLAEDKQLDAAKKNYDATILDLEVQAIDGRIMNAQHQLQIAQVRKPTVDDGVKLMDLRKQQEADRWKSVQDLIGLVNEESKKIVNGSGAPATGPLEATLIKPGEAPSSRPTSQGDLDKINADNNLASKLEQLKQTVAVADELRGRSTDLYQSALKHLKDARDAATGATTALKERRGLLTPKAADRASFDARIDLLDESRFAYRDAEIRQRLARVYADKAIGIAIRADLRNASIPVLQAAGMDPAPEAVSALPQAADVDTAAKKADGAFAEAAAAMDPFFASADGGDPPLYDAKPETTRGAHSKAAFELMMNLAYARSRVLALTGDKSAPDKLTAAVGYANRFKTNYESLPKHAPEEIYAKLGVALTTQPSLRPAPSTAPATGPTTEPSGGPMFNPDGTPITPVAVTPPAGTPTDWTGRPVAGSPLTFFAPPAWTAGPAVANAGLVLLSNAGDGTNMNVVVIPAGTKKIEDAPSEMSEALKAQLPGLNVVSAGMVDFNGEQVAEIVFDTKVNDVDFKGVQIIRPAGTLFTAVTFMTPTGAYDTNLPMFKQIVGTMVISATPTPVPTPAPAPSPAPAPTDGTTPPAPPPTDGTTPPAPPPTDGATPPAPPPTDGTTPPAPPPTDGATPPVPPA